MKYLTQSGVEKIATRYHLDLIILFGSAAKNQLRNESDIDVAILPKKKLPLQQELKLRHELSSFFGREVDLTFLQHASPLLLGQIAFHGKRLYGKKQIFNTFRVNAAKQYLDFQPYFDLREKIISKSIKLRHA